MKIVLATVTIEFLFQLSNLRAVINFQIFHIAEKTIRHFQQIPSDFKVELFEISILLNIICVIVCLLYDSEKTLTSFLALVLLLSSVWLLGFIKSSPIV